jgi:predicted GNAT family acetyltransferase
VGGVTAIPDAAPVVMDNTALRRFEVIVDGVAAFVDYHRTPQALLLTHAEVPVALRGRGHGNRLVRAVLTYLAARGEKIVAQCPFVATYIARNREFASLLA